MASEVMGMPLSSHMGRFPLLPALRVSHGSQWQRRYLCSKSFRPGALCDRMVFQRVMLLISKAIFKGYPWSSDEKNKNHHEFDNDMEE